MSTHEEYQVQLTRITADLDRFGRFFPVMWFNPIVRNGQSIQHTTLSRLSDVYDNDYVVGDIVGLRFLGDYPEIYRTIHKQPEVHGLCQIDPGYCGPCSDKLIYKDRNYYCPDLTRSCPRVVHAILNYAMRPDVLDLPLTKIKNVILQHELQMDLPSVLFLDSEQLEEGCFCNRDESETISEALHQRTTQLFGHAKTPRDVQFAVQRHTIDALSINGLYPDDRRRLYENLYRNHWVWNDLPAVLTDISFLKGCGIRTQDALTIAQNALTRSEELDALAREL